MLTFQSSPQVSEAIDPGAINFDEASHRYHAAALPWSQAAVNAFIAHEKRRRSHITFSMKSRERYYYA